MNRPAEANHAADVSERVRFRSIEKKRSVVRMLRIIKQQLFIFFIIIVDAFAIYTYKNSIDTLRGFSQMADRTGSDVVHKTGVKL